MTLDVWYRYVFKSTVIFTVIYEFSNYVIENTLLNNIFTLVLALMGVGGGWYGLKKRSLFFSVGI
jgi:hypothetical protein